MRNNRGRINWCLSLFIVVMTLTPALADTLGTSTIGGGTGTSSRMTCNKYTALQSGTVSSMSWYGKGSGEVATAVYTDSNNRPYQFLAQSAAPVPINTSAGWYTTNIGLNFGANTDYWLCFWGNGSPTYYYAATTGTNVSVASNEISTSATFNSWPTKFSYNSSSNRQAAIYATFTPGDVPPTLPPVNLTVVKVGAGSGTITGTGINCGTDCSEPMPQGHEVTLSAVPNGGATFIGWSGGGCSGTGTCTVTLNANITVTANFSVGCGSSTSRHVDIDVASSGNGCSWSTAWKSFSNIDWATIRPGDTIWVSGGTYNESLVVRASGTAEKHVVLKASQEEGHNNPVVVLGNIGTYGDNYITFDGAKDDAVVIKNTFDVKTLVPANINWKVKSVNFGTAGGGNGITVRWIEIGNHNRDTDPRFTFGIYWNNDNQWNNIVEYCFFNTINDTGIKTGSNNPVNFDDVIIRHNYFYGAGNDFIEGQAGYTVHNNYFNWQHRWSKPGPPVEGSHADGMAGPMGKTRFYNNILVDVWDQIIYLKIWEFAPNSHGDVYVYGNLIYIDKGATIPKVDGVQVAASFGWETGRPNVPLTNEWGNVVIANNTFIADGTKGPGKILNMLDLVNMYAPYKNGPQSNTVFIKNMKVMNNVFYKSPTNGTSLAGSVGSGFEYTENDLAYDYNLVYSTVAAGRKINYHGTSFEKAEDLNAATAYKHNTSSEPLFKDVSAHDYSLKTEDVAAKDKGADLSYLNLPGFDVDLMGNPRGQGGAWDIGALEYVDLSSDPTDALALHINFNGDSFSTLNNDAYRTMSFADQSGKVNHADCQSAFPINGQVYNQCPTSAAGPDGSKAAHFSGGVTCDMGADYLAVPKHLSIDHLSQGTIAFWAAFDGNGNSDITARFLDTLKFKVPGTWQFHRDGDRYMTFTVNDDTGSETDLLTFPGSLSPIGRWNHYAITWDGNSFKGYYNGVYFGQFARTGFSSLGINTYLGIGTLMHGDVRNSSDGGNCVNQYGGILGNQYVFPNAGYFAGSMDDIRIYKQALPPEGIASLVTGALSPSTEKILTVVKSGTGSGAVGSNVGGIGCGKHCAESFASGMTVTLSASPSIDSTFIGWSGGVCSGVGACQVSMTSNQVVTATFTRKYPVVAIFEAEAGVISAPFYSTGNAILQNIQTTSSTGGRAEYAFSLAQGGNYIVSAVVNAPSGASNSFFVNVDEEPTGANTSMVWDMSTTAGFERRFVSWRGTGSESSPQYYPKVFTLSAGMHTLIVRGREGGVALDSLDILNTTTVNSTQVLGDVSVDGKVTMYDAALVLRFTLGSNLTDAQKTAADINADGKIDGTDVVAIARKAIGL